jgi:hypothetical protein
MRLIETPLLCSAPRVHEAHIKALREAAAEFPSFDYSFLIETAEDALKRCVKWQDADAQANLVDREAQQTLSE